ncbi:MAG: major capsid protein [Acidobacteriota bacterium]|nr:MAG: major capsid protein [Acidobacteriota bacterium]
MLTLTFPTNAELNEVVQAFQDDPSQHIGAGILPINTSMAQKVRWDERDHDRGLTAPHVMGTDPKTDTRQGHKTYEYEPIPFKETDLLKESEILRSRELGTLAGTLDLSSEIARIARDRFNKTMARIEKLRWDTLKGAIAIDENGVKVNETFAVQTHSPLVDWDTLATAKPLADFNALKLKFRKTGATAAGAKAYMNQVTANWLLENQNAADLKGFQNQNFAHLPYSVEEMNKILAVRGLPEIVVYDGGYVNENDTFVPFLADAEVIVIGKRPAGQNVGDFMSTPSLHNSANGQPAPGYFSIIEVNGQPSEAVGSVSMGQLGSAKNPKVEITGGIYGGTRLLYPKSVIKFLVS